MQSFYGGRPGDSFIIVKSFSSEEEMIDNFKNGMDYNEVYFNEYVIINNPNNSIQNGKIYKRGYNFSNENGGAEYICKIQGPAGLPVSVELCPYKKITPSNEYIIYSNDQNDNESTYIQPYNGESAIEYIPGAIKDGDEWTHFNNDILFKYYQIKDNANNRSVLKIGFKIPYPVFDFKVELTNESEGDIVRIDDGNNNFFSQWKIKIPRALDGDLIKKIEVISLGNEINNNEISYEWFSDNSTEQNEKKDSDMYNHRSILVATIMSSNNQIKRYYISDFDLIKKIDITENGYLEFKLNDTQSINSSTPILPSIEDVSLDDNGTLSIEWKNIDQSPQKNIFSNKIQWVDNFKIKNGKLYAVWNIFGEDESENYNSSSDSHKTTEVEVENTKLITDLKMVDGLLYESHLGINNENDNSSDYQTFNDIRYKKCLNIQQMINDAIDKRFAEFEGNSYFPTGTVISREISTELTMTVDKYPPNALQLYIKIKLEKLIPPETGIIQRGRINPDTSCIKRIYLTPPENSILSEIYGNEGTDEQRITRWKNLNYDSMNNDDPNNDLRKFYADSDNTSSKASKTAFLAIVSNADYFKNQDNYDTTATKTLREDIIKYLSELVLTGAQIDQSSQNLSIINQGKIWIVETTKDGQLLMHKNTGGTIVAGGSPFFPSSLSNPLSFTIPITIAFEIQI